MTQAEMEAVRERALHALLDIAEGRNGPMTNLDIRVQAAQVILHAPVYEDDDGQSAAPYGGTD